MDADTTSLEGGEDSEAASLAAVLVATDAASPAGMECSSTAHLDGAEQLRMGS